MSRELKIGILTFIVLVTMIWGYTFLKGRNLLTAANELHSTYADIEGLNVSSPVLVNGYKIGTVTKIVLNSENVKLMDVFYLIDSDYKIPKTAIANLKSLGVVDGKGIFLDFDKVCNGDDCAKNGDKLEGGSIGLLEAMLGDSDISAYSSELTKSLRSVIANVGKEGEPGSLNESVRQLEQITKNINALTASTNTLVASSSAGIKRTTDNMATITNSLAKSNQKIEGLLANLDKITADLAKSNLSNTVLKTNETLDASKVAITELKSTLETTGKTMSDLSQVLKKLDSGDGSVAKLMNDKKLYQNIESTTKNLDLLLQDLRLNPKRYAHFSVFGKKQKEYTLPQNDPAVILEK
jgi:phospholipid/cholesterol/gamma-HCH transport system substrate-binding protein